MVSATTGICTFNDLAADAAAAVRLVVGRQISQTGKGLKVTPTGQPRTVYVTANEAKALATSAALHTVAKLALEVYQHNPEAAQEILAGFLHAHCQDRAQLGGLWRKVFDDYFDDHAKEIVDRGVVDSDCYDENNNEVNDPYNPIWTGSDVHSNPYGVDPALPDPQALTQD